MGLRLTTLAAAALLLCGCEEEGDFFGRVRPQHGPGELVINLGAEPEFLDPGLASESSGGTVIRNTFAGLVQVHPQTLEPMPDIARRWEVSEDQRVYTFHLRDTTWSDGRPLTAEDFEWSWKRVLDPATGSKYASFAYSIQNGAAFNQRALYVTGLGEDVTEEQVKQAFERAVPVDRVETTDWPRRAFFVHVGGEDDEKDALRARAVERMDGATVEGSEIDVRVADRQLVGVRALDDHTLEVRLANPLPFFLDQLTFYTMRPVPRHVLDRLEREGKDPALWTRPENWVSNGAYVIEQWEFRQYYLLRKNRRYWDAGHVRLDSIRMYLVENANTTLNLYRTADIDWIGQNSVLPNEFIHRLRPYRDLHTNAYLGVYFYWVNVEAEPVDDVRVRRALSLAIDRPALTEHITRGGQIPMGGLVPDGLAGYDAPDFPLFDPERAREELAAAGYPNGRGLPTITLTYNTAEGHRQIAEAIQQMWKEHLGIEVELENQEWKVYLKNLKQRNFQVGRMGWIGDYADPYTFLEVLSQYSGNNHSGWKNDEYDRLLERANATADPEERLRILRRAEEIAMDELPILPIYVYARLDMVKPYVRGYWGNIQNIHPMKWMWIDERFYDGVPSEWRPEEPPPPMIPME